MQHTHLSGGNSELGQELMITIFTWSKHNSDTKQLNEHVEKTHERRMSAKSALVIMQFHTNNTYSTSYESWQSTNSNCNKVITLRQKLTETASEKEEK